MVSLPIGKKKESAGEARVTVQKESSLLSRVQRLFSRKGGTERKACHRCGTENPQDVYFCKKCGSRYPDNAAGGGGEMPVPGTSPGSPEVQAEEKKRSFLERGNAHFKAGQYAKALEMYDKALSLDSSYAKAWNNRSLALQKLGRNREAADSRQRFLALQKPEK